MGLSSGPGVVHCDLHLADLNDDLEQPETVCDRTGANRTGLASLHVLEEGQWESQVKKNYLVKN